MTSVQQYTEKLDENILRFDYEWRQGSRVKAQEIAIDYVNSHRAYLEPILMRYTREMLVKEVERLRADERLSDRIVVDMWLLSEYPLGQITGVINVSLPPTASMVEALGD